MKKIITGFLVICAAQGSLLLGAENLEGLYLTSPLRKTCTSLWNRYVSNTREQNDACEKLSAQYDFLKEQPEFFEIFKSVENDRDRHEKCPKMIEADFLENALLSTGSWDLIGKILPEAGAEQKRIEYNELARLKFDLANIKRQKELRSVLFT